LTLVLKSIQNGQLMKPYFVLLIGVVSVAFAAIFIRLAEAHPLVIATYRLSLAALVLAPVAWFKARQELLSRSSWQLSQEHSWRYILRFGFGL
jgi:hypothetical protein